MMDYGQLWSEKLTWTFSSGELKIKMWKKGKFIFFYLHTRISLWMSWDLSSITAEKNGGVPADLTWARKKSQCSDRWWWKTLSYLLTSTWIMHFPTKSDNTCMHSYLFLGWKKQCPYLLKFVEIVLDVEVTTDLIIKLRICRMVFTKPLADIHVKYKFLSLQ